MYKSPGALAVMYTGGISRNMVRLLEGDLVMAGNSLCKIIALEVIDLMVS